jgi:hypothetical protein
MGTSYDGSYKVSQGGSTSTLAAVEKFYDQGRTISSVVFAKDAESNGPKQKGTETPAQAVIRTRKNPVLAARECQLNINVLGLRGGRPYVNSRLARFPGEPELMWSGGTANSTHIQGRKQQTHVLPYLSRIASKINQYIFGQGIQREGADEDVMDDITRTGQSIDQFMRGVSDLITACGWCWIGVDLPAITDRTTLAEQRNSKIRAYWQLYAPQEVVDWSYSETGVLEWLLLETQITKTADATTPRSTHKARVNWTPQSATVYVYKNGKNGMPKEEIMSEEEIPHTFGLVPFVLAGSPSPLPHVFDSLEGVNKTIMDLMSANRTNFFEGVFPMRYFPASQQERWMDDKMQGGKPAHIGAAIGMHDACFVEEGETPPGVVAVNSSDFEAMRRECEYLKHELFETAGLLIKQESRAAQSADSKAFDQLEIEQGLRERAQVLQEAEEKAVAISVAIDNNFKDYQPKYPDQFSVRDFVKELETYVLLGNMILPDGVNKLVVKKVIDTLAKMGVPSSKEEIEALMKEAEGFEGAESGIMPAIEVEGEIAE